MEQSLRIIQLKKLIREYNELKISLDCKQSCRTNISDKIIVESILFGKILLPIYFNEANTIVKGSDIITTIIDCIFAQTTNYYYNFNSGEIIFSEEFQIDKFLIPVNIFSNSITFRQYHKKYLFNIDSDDKRFDNCDRIGTIIDSYKIICVMNSSEEHIQMINIINKLR